ncbi:MAG: thioredoxin-like negative regulator of GroEL [Myxococcota bacterium]
MVLLIGAVALAVAPEVELSWSGAHSTLEVRAPPGHELSPDAPAGLVLDLVGRRVDVQGEGRMLAGVALGEVRGGEVSGTLHLTVCSKADGTCVPRELAFTGAVPEQKRGAVDMTVAPVAPPVLPAEEVGPFKSDAAAAADAAFAAATARGDRVLLDFSAVWCPPCNQLAAEVLHADPLPSALDGWTVVVLDVDDPSSFALKDRYDVGGYPTIVATDAEGTELSRVVGYPGREAFLGWVQAAGDPAAPDATSPEAAGQIAWDVMRRGGDPTEWIARAEAAPTTELRLARMNVGASAEDARWLAEHAPGTASDWVYPALKLVEADPSLRPVLHDALRRDLARAEGREASDLAFLLGSLEGPDAGQPWFASAAAALRLALTGDPDLDRAHYTWLADLQARAGDVDGATKFLGQQADRWPDEPTWHLTAGRILLDAERAEEALEWTTVGMDRSWGDNRLRMAALHARALVAAGREGDAATVAQQTLDALPAADELGVRTHRYREKLAAFLR